MDALLLLVVAAVGLALLWRRVAHLERRVAELERGTRPVRAPVPAGPVPAEPSAEPPAVAPAQAPRPSPRARFEHLLGGTLPIWIGGAALVLAAFYGVTLAIDQGLIGPAARTTVAAGFGLLLLVGSEAARALRWTRDDARLAQALAGAGVAVLFISLYLAASLYHLLGVGPALVLLAGVTLLGIALALRHGPATAVMALIGGFVAPLLAGPSAIGVTALLIYLAVLIAALMGLALRRGWSWLALAAAAGGFGWANLLLVTLGGEGAPGIGGFVLLLAVGASLAQPAAAQPQARWRTLAPLVAGMAQLLVLGPVLRFSTLEWALYLLLSAAALALAWRRPVLLPGAGAALATMLAALALALGWHESGGAPAAAIAATLLFGGSGACLSRHARGWAVIALVGIAGPLIVAELAEPALLAPAGWALAAAALAFAAAALAWRHRDRAGVHDAGLVGGSLAAAVLLGAGAAAIAPAWLGVAFTAIGGLLYAAGRGSRDGDVAALPVLALLATVAVAIEPLWQFGLLMAESLAGAHLTYPLLPPVAATLQHLALPAAAAAGLALADRSAFGRARQPAIAAAAVLGLLALYHLAKLPLAIATEPDFTARGFTERAVLSQALLAAATILRGRARRLSDVLLALGLFRIVWFDLVLLDPVAVRQAVGALPLVNAAAIHAALAALWLWRAGERRPWRLATLAATLLAALAVVRQATHGSFLTGPITRPENWAYSAALLLLSIAWLWRGIAGRREAARLAGLGLLTLTTLKVFLIDAAALGGVLRILSFLGLGLALIGIGWAYGRMARVAQASP